MIQLGSKVFSEHLGCVHTYTSSCLFVIWSFSADCYSRSERDMTFCFVSSPSLLCVQTKLLHVYFYYSLRGMSGSFTSSKGQRFNTHLLLQIKIGKILTPKLLLMALPSAWMADKKVLWGAGWAESTVLLLMSWLACCMAIVSLCHQEHVFLLATFDTASLLKHILHCWDKYSLEKEEQGFD